MSHCELKKIDIEMSIRIMTSTKSQTECEGTVYSGLSIRDCDESCCHGSRESGAGYCRRGPGQSSYPHCRAQPQRSRVGGGREEGGGSGRQRESNCVRR